MKPFFTNFSQNLTQKVGLVSRWVILLTLSLALLPLFLTIPPALELGVFIFLIVSLGIPHGATDHIVFFSQQNHNPKKSSWTYFFKVYLGIMFAYALAWYFFPLLSFIAFLSFSAYHFGQSQLYYVAIKKKKWFKFVLYTSWGNIVLLSILGFNDSETLIILHDTPFLALMQFVFLHFPYFFWLNLVLLLIVLLILGLQKEINFSKIFQELILLALLIFLSWSTSLLWSFAIYFALWHSFQTIEQEIIVFGFSSGKKYTWRNYLKDALPFSLLSFVGIGLILVGLYVFEFSKPNLLFGFFVMISILTAPHAWLIKKIYEETPHID